MSGMKEPEWSEWVESRPEPVRTMCKEYPPDVPYILKSTGQKVHIYSYNEKGTVTVNIYAKENETMIFGDRSVFGIDPEDLEKLQ